LESAKQSRRTDIPEIAEASPLTTVLASDAAPVRILLSETEQTVTLAEALRTHVSLTSQLHHDGFDVNHQPASFRMDLAIGPEGGWTPEEMSLFTQHAWTHVTLGPRILRAETAAIAAIAIASSHLA
jgi:16S rRNA (uracil1498-N3)-methyltransferase